MACIAGRPCRHAGRDRRGRSRVRAARRRRDDRPTHGLVGFDRRGVRPRRSRAAARSGDRRLARRAGGGTSMEADLSAAGSALAWLGRLTGRRPTISRTKPTTWMPAPRDCWRSRGSVVHARRGGRRARVCTFAGLTPQHTAGAPGTSAGGRGGVRRSPLPRPRGARRGRAVARRRRSVDAAVAPVLSGVAQPAGRRPNPRRGRIRRRGHHHRTSARFAARPRPARPGRRARAAVRFGRRRLRRPSDAPRDGGARHDQRARRRLAALDPPQRHRPARPPA